MGPVGLESSVRIPQTKTTTFKIQQEQYGYNKDTMRDLYHRKDRLKYWMNRIHSDLEEPDRSDVLQLVENMQERERAILWIIRCITALLSMRKQLAKPFREVSKSDIKDLLLWMDEKGYKASTHEKYRQLLKLFYKTIYGNNEYYPDCVKWFSVKVGNEKASKDPTMNMAEYLEEIEIQKLIEAAPTLQKKAFLACMYESGARPEEFLRLSNLDCKIDTHGAILILRGKTGERRVRTISFAKTLQQWLEVHPLKNHQKQFPLWISDATNFKNQPLGLRGAQKIIEEAMSKANLVNKHSRLYILRHSRASVLATYFTEAQLCTFFGWVQGSQVVKRYIHMSGKDLDNTLISISEGKQAIKQDEYLLKTKKCNRCTETISPTQQFCGRCGLSITLIDQYTKEMDIERENRELKQQIQIVKEEMNDKFNKIISMIQKNPLLANIKPDKLKNKL
ncbi:MAG TPA: site-specific integrase [Nitrososphaeraceae archaeon]|nr:site-specific integrase [Nitrososphaeraceae archaeon]